MSGLSRGRSPGGSHSRNRGASSGPGPTAGSSYSSEAEDPLLDASRHSSSNTSPSHTLAGQGAGHDTSHGNSIWYDDLDTSSVLEPEKKLKALEILQSKISKTKEQIKHEQNSRDSNVEEYLR